MASEVFITRRGLSSYHSNIYLGIITRNAGTYLLGGTYTRSYNFIAPSTLIGNKILVECIGGGGGSSYIANSNSGNPRAFGLAGGGGGWYNYNIIDCTRGQKIGYTLGSGGRSGVYAPSNSSNDAYFAVRYVYPSTGSTTSFGTYLSANGGSKGVAMLTETMFGGITNYSYLTSTFGSTYGATGGSGGSGGGAIFWDMNNAIGGRGYQFGGGAGGKGGDGGIWGGGGAGLYNGGNGGVYGGGGGGGTTGGRGGCSNPANGALATTRYGGNAGNNGTTMQNINYDQIGIAIDLTNQTIISHTYSWNNANINGTCSNIGNKMVGGGGYGGNTSVNKHYTLPKSLISNCLNICGGGGYLGNVDSMGLSGGGGKGVTIKSFSLSYANLNSNFLISGGGGGVRRYSNNDISYNNTSTLFGTNVTPYSSHDHNIFADYDYETIMTKIMLPLCIDMLNSEVNSAMLIGAPISYSSDNYFNNIYFASGGGGVGLMGESYGGRGGSIIRCDINKQSELKYIYNMSWVNSILGRSHGQGGYVGIYYYYYEK